MDKNLEKLKESLAKIDDKYKEIKGDMSVDPKMDKQNQMMDYMYQCMSNLRDYIYGAEDRMHSKMDNHMVPNGKTHAPHLNSASAVENYLDACGMSEDYIVQKPTIQVKASRQGNKEFEVELNIPYTK